MKVQSHRHWTIALMLVCLVQVNGVNNTLVISTDPLDGQLVSVGILPFRDDSGMGLRPEMSQKLAQDFQQRLAGTFKDLLPRVISGAGDVAATSSLTVEQIAALGKQNGVRFVIRGGVLALTSEKAGQETKVSAQLYAEIISTDTASIVSTLRAEGTATQAGAVETLTAIDLTRDQFRSSATNRALTDAIAQLVESSHQALIAPTSTEGQASSVSTNVEDGLTSAQADAAKAAESDTELEQLIAQAEGILANGANVSTESINGVSKALETLKSTLAAKASLMEKGQDTAEIDQELVTRKETLQVTVAQVTAEVSAASETASGEVEQPSGEKKGLLTKIDEFSGQALSILQKIQEIRATVLGVAESAVGETDPNYEGMPIEEGVSEANGVVLDENGNPIDGANVSDQESGAETTTDSNGVYNLKGLVNGKLAKLLVTKGQMKMSAQADVWPGHPVILDFQYKPKFVKAKISGFGVLPSTVLLDSSKNPSAARGSLHGIVQDAQGRPIPRALVTLRGLGVTRTDSQGQYTFLGVPSGTHQLLVNQTGLKTKSVQVQVVAKKSNQARLQFAPADSLAKLSAKGSLILRQGGSTLRGTILDNDNHPIAGAKVSVVQQIWSAHVLTGPKGSFEIKNLKPGPYRMAVSRVGFESTNQGIVLPANGTEDRNLQLRKQSSSLVSGVLKNEMERRRTIRNNVQPTSRGEVKNSTTRITDSRSGHISGRVTDAESGKPVQSAIIAIEGQQQSRTDRQGNYELKNLAAGNYKIRVSVAGYSAETKSIKVREGNLSREDFALKTERRLTPQITEDANRPGIRISERSKISAAGVTGQVIDGRTRRPIAGAAISIPGRQGATTDAAGKFLIGNLTPGNYQIGVGKSGYSSEQRTIQVRPGETVNMSFTLTTRALPSIRLPRP
ncbi:MAG TPA: carboxypeptidase regulatory-like domain-containing protein [Pyrinomonadaceae bacterium]|nr:carboxypeptidase regulatory-like domain-containing protein [Pyrinomonadaceae bacterium]